MDHTLLTRTLPRCLTVVVRTGDHTLIGKSESVTEEYQYIVGLMISKSGQIAKLTGGETGNKSPLAVEMYAHHRH